MARPKRLEEKKVRVSSVLSKHLKLANGKSGRIETVEDIENYSQIATSCDELYRIANDSLTKDEIDYYQKLAVKYANLLKAFFLEHEGNLPIEIKKQLELRPEESEPQRFGRLTKFRNFFKYAFDVLGRNRDFDSYCIAMEWNRPKQKQFYMPRRDVLIKHGIIRDIQDLIDKKIKMLIIEAPVGIGKSVLGELFSSFKNGLSFEARGLIGNANDALTNGFYNDILGFIESQEYRFGEIFYPTPKVITNASINAIYFGEKRREPNVLCRSIEVGATGLTHINEEGYLYMDDIVKTAEQANNKDYLQKLIYAFTSTFYDRLENDEVPILVIGTPWSLYDLIGYLKGLYGGEKWFRVNSIPAYKIDESGTKVTNFPYKGKHFKTVEYWEKLMKADDPVIANAKFLMQPVEREGRIFENLSYFRIKDLYQRMKNEKPFVTNATDVATKKGGDFWASGFFYSFESTREVYLVDVVYSNAGTEYTIPKTVEKYLQHKVERGEFEEKEGAITGEYTFGIADKISKEIKNKGFKANIKNHSGSGLKSKGNRIDTYANEINGIEIQNGWTLRILHEEDRRGHAEYNLAVQHLKNYSQSKNMQGKQIDDIPDMLAMNFQFNLDVKNQKAKTFKIRI